MATNYPGSIDSITRPLTSNPMNSPSHTQVHDDVADAVEAIETELGTNPSGTYSTVGGRLDKIVNLHRSYNGTRPLYGIPGSQVLSVSANVTATANRIYMQPFFVAQAITITDLQIYVRAAAAAGKFLKLGIYASAASTGLASGAPLYSGSNIAADATGQKTVSSLSVSLSPGLYYFASWSDGTPGYTGWNTSCPGWGGMFQLEFSYNQYIHDLTYGSWPTSPGETNVIDAGYHVFAKWTVN